MLNFRPHTLKVANITKGGKDSLGQPLPDTETWTDVPCRIEANGSGSKVVYLDGEAHNYSYVVYLDQDCPEFRRGEKVKLFGLDEMELKGDMQFEVLHFFRNQLNAKLWV